MNTRTCPICNSPVSGRVDKKYCSDQSCARANNNKLESQRLLIMTNQAFRKNRSILKTLCHQGKAIVRKEILISKGFNVDYFTSIFVTRSKQVYYLCYDYGYTPLMEGDIEKALIISRQDYMKGWNPWRFLAR